eukprot:NODE_946_length_1802_cov_33.129492_g833_i0.p2 GENE.NODE_946_length_1802_cov_33.129492_g833_i0~~NODE_946_length_1802_cov_33.129492_g833_i0.p2  ORF type:complete len:186 (+),score=18.52 NODE_946_length_1802_cov_33.129492_g833_i0:339-896(+)
MQSIRRSGGWCAWGEHNELLMELKPHLEEESARLLRALNSQQIDRTGRDDGVGVEEGKDRSATQSLSRLYCWLSIQREGGFHASHAHSDAALSGVYFVRVPNNAGRLVFSDPRGVSSFHPTIRGVPPFDNEVFFRPTDGDLVLFPGWLVHRVEPTEGMDDRISVPFNVLGRWADSTHIRTTLTEL